MKQTVWGLVAIPKKILREVIDTVRSIFLLTINGSLSTGYFPSVFEHAVVQPLLKKPNLDFFFYRFQSFPFHLNFL